MPNRLAQETSPYLLQHANNPVDWYPWGEEALAKAALEEKPIFLSIGYSACHWCHVMEHESFENEGIAQAMNERFVCVKVDREERPDLDQIYMQAVQIMNGGRGGWPMSVFLTPDLRPFYGGTYWPPEPRMGMPGFPQVLHAVHDAWINKHEQILQQAAGLTAHLNQEPSHSEDGPLALTEEVFRTVSAKLEQSFDGAHGGFGGAPKFPHATDLQLLLRIWRRLRGDELLNMVKLSLDKMFAGGIYDHLGGGFARYSVDARWLVPHFEKMLYDNASLANAYLDGYLVTGQPRYAQVVRETLDYILHDMTDECGGFHSAEDADSEGEEGKFYVWTPAEVLALLGEERGNRFCYVYDVTEAGNFEGHNIANLPKSIAQCAQLKGWNLAELEQELNESKAVLLEARSQRIRPGKDDKILVSWNGLMIDAMARAAGVLGEPRYLAAAQKAAGFIVEKLRRSDGRLLHTYRAGEAKLDGFLDDYTHLINGLISLYEADFDERWIDHAVALTDLMARHFVDKQQGGFFFTADDHEQLIARKKDLIDSSTPSGAGMAATVLTRLGKLCGRADYLTLAGETLHSAGWLMEQSPTAAGQLLLALDCYLGPFLEIVVLGDQHEADSAAVLSDLRRRYIPNKAVACRVDAEQDGSENIDPVFIGKVAEQLPTAYVCERFTCQPPIEGRESIVNRWLVLEVAAKEKALNLKQIQ